MGMGMGMGRIGNEQLGNPMEIRINLKNGNGENGN